MMQLLRSLCALACVSSLFLVSEGQFFDTRGASVGQLPAGFISRIGAYGDQEHYASLGNAPVGVYQRQNYPPQLLYQAPRILPVQVYPPANPIARPQPNPVMYPPPKPVVRPPYKPVVRPPYKPVVRPPYKPVVRPPYKPACTLPGSCGTKPARPVRPPPAYPAVRPPMKPGVRPPQRPGRPYGRPNPKMTRRPQTHKPPPGYIKGRSGGGLLGGGLLGSGLLGGMLGGLG